MAHWADVRQIDWAMPIFTEAMLAPIRIVRLTSENSEIAEPILLLPVELLGVIAGAAKLAVLAKSAGIVRTLIVIY